MCVINPETCESTTHTQCIPACNDCQSCRDIAAGDDVSYSCVNTYQGVKVCEDGICVGRNEQCPEDCSPGCDPCERCTRDADGSSRCSDVGEKLCNGQCVSHQFNCEVYNLDEPLLEAEDPVVFSLFDYFSDFSWPW